jgi:hypothetical protein
MFMSFDLGIGRNGVAANLDDIKKTELVILKKENSKRDSSAIQTDVANLFTSYFERSNCTLGQTINLDYLNNAILAIDGVEKFYTRRTDDNSVQYEGLSFLMWNPIYLNDRKFVVQNIVLSYFMFPFLNDFVNFKNKITVQSNTKVFETLEY